MRRGSQLRRPLLAFPRLPLFPGLGLKLGPYALFGFAFTGIRESARPGLALLLRQRA